MHTNVAVLTLSAEQRNDVSYLKDVLRRLALFIECGRPLSLSHSYKCIVKLYTQKTNWHACWKYAAAVVR